ncbi:uncharacterized protein LOC27208280 [Drosophila simulans]|uniref:Uncharacterized protein n=1 Tax=Drosophila simulans TaxID=7240 RepID=A0A0J9RIL3_DROSI|nr:uncharacterized protein LOC27208280 [Drosophila simulans]KMY95334.1 uncharacterized protein Dsimw501_GD28432 [Drosophila simulans]
MSIKIVGLLFMLAGQSLGELVRIDLKDLGFQISGSGLNSRPKSISSNHKNKTLSEYNVYLNEYYSSQWQQFYLAQAAYNQYYGLYTVYSPYESYGPYVIYDPYKTPGHHGHRGHRHRPKPTKLPTQSYPFLQPLLRRLRQFLPIKVRFVPRKKSKPSRRRRKPQLRHLQPYPLQLQKPIKYAAKN